MLLPFAVSLVSGDGAASGFGLSLAVTLPLGIVAIITSRRHRSYELRHIESLWITAVAWTVVPAVGALPYLFTNSTSNVADALFESFSGFTTTGSSVFGHPEALPHSLLVWRSLTQWMGGLGLMLFLIATVRSLSVGSLRLYGAEFSGTVQRKLHPRIATSVRYMWTVYLFFTALLFAGLMLCGNGLEQSFCLALSTVSTGGFVPSSNTMAAISPLTATLLTLFMFLSGVNVALLYHLLRGGFLTVWRDEEFRVYIGLYLAAVVSCIVALLLAGNDIGISVAYPFFHIASTISTCGYCLPKPVVWTQWLSAVTFVFILTGASAGSTGGGIKLKRLMILLKYVGNYFTRMLHPNAVFRVSVNGKPIEADYVNKVFGYVFLYVLFVVAGGFVLTLSGCDIPVSLCVSAANMGNLGPSPLISSMGAAFDYATLPSFAKLFLAFLMTAGRIEIFALLALFVKR